MAEEVTMKSELEKAERFVNLTPHEICVLCGDQMVRIPTSGKVVRVKTKTKAIGNVLGAAVIQTTDGEVSGMPDPEDGAVYLVSSVVAKKVMRPDVMSPDTSDDGVIRDGNGYIVAVKRLQIFV